MKKLLLVDENGTRLELHKEGTDEFILKLEDHDGENGMTMFLNEKDREYLMLELINLKQPNNHENS